MIPIGYHISARFTRDFAIFREISSRKGQLFLRAAVEGDSAAGKKRRAGERRVRRVGGQADMPRAAGRIRAVFRGQHRLERGGIRGGHGQARKVAVREQTRPGDDVGKRGAVPAGIVPAQDDGADGDPSRERQTPARTGHSVHDRRQQSFLTLGKRYPTRRGGMRGKTKRGADGADAQNDSPAHGQLLSPENGMCGMSVVYAPRAAVMRGRGWE